MKERGRERWQGKSSECILGLTRVKSKKQTWHWAGSDRNAPLTKCQPLQQGTLAQSSPVKGEMACLARQWLASDQKLRKIGRTVLFAGKW